MFTNFLFKGDDKNNYRVFEVKVNIQYWSRCSSFFRENWLSPSTNRITNARMNGNIFVYSCKIRGWVPFPKNLFHTLMAWVWNPSSRGMFYLFSSKFFSRKKSDTARWKGRRPAFFATFS